MCGAYGVEAAHRNEGKGKALKVDDSLTAALCRPCHRDIDQGMTMDRDERQRVMDEAILRTLIELTRRGLVGPK